MTGPALDAYRFGFGCLIGGILGIFYGFFRPLRKHHPVIGDLLFTPFLIYGWLYLCFAVCRGDIRIGYCMGLPIGIFLWELTVGRLLRPLFQGFWWLIGRIFKGIGSIFQKILKKLRKFAKKLFASWKKWFTMVRDIRSQSRKTQGGVPRGKKEKSAVCLQTQSPAAQMRSFGNRGSFRRRTDRPDRRRQPLQGRNRRQEKPSRPA